MSVNSDLKNYEAMLSELRIFMNVVKTKCDDMMAYSARCCEELDNDNTAVKSNASITKNIKKCYEALEEAGKVYNKIEMQRDELIVIIDKGNQIGE